MWCTIKSSWKHKIFTVISHFRIKLSYPLYYKKVVVIKVPLRELVLHCVRNAVDWY